MLTLCNGTAAGNKGNLGHIQPNANIRAVHIDSQLLIASQGIGIICDQVDDILIVIATADLGNLDVRYGIHRAVCMGIESKIFSKITITQLSIGWNYNGVFSLRDRSAT